MKTFMLAAESSGSLCVKHAGTRMETNLEKSRFGKRSCSLEGRHQVQHGASKSPDPLSVQVTVRGEQQGSGSAAHAGIWVFLHRDVSHSPPCSRGNGE